MLCDRRLRRRPVYFDYCVHARAAEMQKPRYLSSSVNEPRALPPKQRRGERSLASDDRLSPAFTGTGITFEAYTK